MDGIVIVTHTRLDYDSRIRRQIELFSKNYKVIVGSQTGDLKKLPCQNGNVTFIQLPFIKKSNIASELLRIYVEDDKIKLSQLMDFGKKIKLDVSPERIYELYRADFYSIYVELYHEIIANNINVKAILCNDVFLLPNAVRLKRALQKSCPGVKLIGDMHELHFNYIDDPTNYSAKVRVWLVDTFLPYCDLVLSVSEVGRRLYQQRYPKKKVITVKNVPEYCEIEPSNNGKKIRLVHVGALQKSREPLKMLECLTLLPNQYTLDCYMPVGDAESQKEQTILEDYVRKHNLKRRVEFHEPVSSEELIKVINQYDIGIYYINPKMPNQVHYLPNKLFEYIQARLAVVMTPLESPKAIIEEYDIGKVSSDFTIEQFAKTVVGVADQLAYYKNQSAKAANIFQVEREWSPVLKYVNCFSQKK